MYLLHNPFAAIIAIIAVITAGFSLRIAWILVSPWCSYCGARKRDRYLGMPVNRRRLQRLRQQAPVTADEGSWTLSAPLSGRLAAGA